MEHSPILKFSPSLGTENSHIPTFPLPFMDSHTWKMPVHQGEVVAFLEESGEGGRELVEKGQDAGLGPHQLGTAQAAALT